MCNFLNSPWCNVTDKLRHSGEFILASFASFLLFYFSISKSANETRCVSRRYVWRLRLPIFFLNLIVRKRSLTKDLHEGQVYSYLFDFKPRPEPDQNLILLLISAIGIYRLAFYNDIFFKSRIYIQIDSTLVLYQVKLYFYIVRANIVYLDAHVFVLMKVSPGGSFRSIEGFIFLVGNYRGISRKRRVRFRVWIVNGVSERCNANISRLHRRAFVNYFSALWSVSSSSCT